MDHSTSENPPPDSTTAPPSYLHERGLASWLLTTDHKRIALLYTVLLLASFFAGILFAVLVRLQLLTPAPSAANAETFARLRTLHGAVMVFLVLTPAIPATLGTFVLPLMLGARNLAYPRLNLLGFYLYAAAALGCTLSLRADEPRLQAGAALLLALASCLQGSNALVTILRRRAPGMHLLRMPLLVWSLLATALVQVAALPLSGLRLVLEAMGRLPPALIGDPLLFTPQASVFSSPALYLTIVPALGVVSELIATFARKPVLGYGAAVLSLLGISLVGCLAWAVHLLYQGPELFAAVLFSYLAMISAVLMGTMVCRLVATLYRSQLHLTTPLWYALSFLCLFSIGGLSGLFLAALATDASLRFTSFAVGHFHLMTVGGTMMALLGGLYYWWPKITGRRFSEALGKAGCLLLFVGTSSAFLAHLVMGVQGVPRRVLSYAPDAQPLQIMATLGSLVLALGFVTVVYSLVLSARGKRAPADPWGGTTLEWQTGSPPPRENFLHPPVLRREPCRSAVLKTGDRP